jgi:hypothetical protein
MTFEHRAESLMMLHANVGCPSDPLSNLLANSRPRVVFELYDVSVIASVRPILTLAAARRLNMPQANPWAAPSPVPRTPQVPSSAGAQRQVRSLVEQRFRESLGLLNAKFIGPLAPLYRVASVP